MGEKVEEMRLTHMEYQIAGALALAGEPIEARDIAGRVYGYPDESAATTVRQHIGNIRQKLGASAIRNKYEGGYEVDRSVFAQEGIALPVSEPLDVYPRAGGFVELRSGTERLVLSVAQCTRLISEMERRRMLV